jgi:EAL domain-containing protein (putative c-di-GMP-specific phosphodiesterase class I)/FixJ family two-component response regulator
MPGSNLNFLVVEDHDFQRRVFVKLLQSLGASAVYDAEDGRAALEVLRDPDRRVDIVVSDLSMPGMDGMEFIRHLSETGAQVSLIVASALEPELLAAIANMARAYKVNLLGVLGKPASARKLVPLLEMHRARQPEAGQDELAADAPFTLAEIADGWAHSEFQPWFEPQVELGTGRVRGMLATARWRHPTRGLLEPAVFLPSVLARGLSDDFSWMMIQRSAAQCCLWLQEGLDLTVWVNLAFQSLQESDLAMRVRQIAANEGLEPRHLILSVSESALNTGQARTLENLARLRVEGHGLAIDEFGSGDMAVDRLSLVAFTHIRVKSSYVTGIDHDESARAGLAVSLDLAQQMKLRAVADGITSKGEWALLQQWGCEFGQGPFISAAMPGDGVPAWARRWTGETIR